MLLIRTHNRILFCLNWNLNNNHFFIMNDGRVGGACKLSSKVALQRRVGGRETVTTHRKQWLNLWVGQDSFVWSHLGLSVFPLHQPLGCICKTFTFFPPPPPSVGDFAQPRGLLNIDLKFFIAFIKLPWFSRMACTLYITLWSRYS